MSGPRIEYSQELRDVLAQHTGGAIDAAVLDAVSVLGGRLAEVRVFPVWAAAEEGAEVSADGAALRVAVLQSRFGNPARLAQFLRHELVHVADILDHTFEYGGAPDRLTMTPALRRGCKLLWACSIDGRTARLGGMPLHSSEEYQTEFARRFPGLPPAALRAAFKRLWHEARPCYRCLIQMAADFNRQPVEAPVAAGPAVSELRISYAAGTT